MSNTYCSKTRLQGSSCTSSFSLFYMSVDFLNFVHTCILLKCHNRMLINLTFMTQGRRNIFPIGMGGGGRELTNDFNWGG